MAFHEKFFRVPKLRFLAGPASLLDEVSRGTQNWSVRAVTISNQSISVTFQTFRPFLVIWGHFRPFWPFLAILAPNSKLSQTSQVTTQNDRKKSRNPMEMVSDDNSNEIMSLQAILCHFGAIKSHFRAQRQN